MKMYLKHHSSHIFDTQMKLPLLVHLQVSEMKAEYFPPKEDVILQNEAPTDFYILVNGTAVIKLYKVLYNFVELYEMNARLTYFYYISVMMQDLVDVNSGTETVSRVTWWMFLIYVYSFGLQTCDQL